MSEPKKNKDGLPIGEPVDFKTLQATLTKHRKEAKENGGKPKQARKPKPKVRETGQSSIPDVPKAEEA